MTELCETRAQERGAIFAQTRAKSFDQSDKFDAGLPGKKFADVLFNDGLGARDFAFASLAILLHDVGEIVHVVDVNVIEFGCGCFDVAWHAEIHDKERAIAASGHGGFQDLARQHRLFGADGGNDHVRLEQRGVPVRPTR